MKKIYCFTIIIFLLFTVQAYSQEDPYGDEYLKRVAPPDYITGIAIGFSSCDPAREYGVTFLQVLTTGGNVIRIELDRWIINWLNSQPGGWQGHYLEVTIYWWHILPPEWRELMGFRRAAFDFELTIY